MWQVTSKLSGRITPPRNWCEWLALLPRLDVANTLDISRRAAAEWAVHDQLGEPSSVIELASRLLASRDEVASERLAEALPVLIAWFGRDTEFPRASLRSIYDALWTLLVLGVRRGQAERESSASLFHGLLACGLPADRYKELLQDALDIAGDPGRKSAYWILGLVESTIEQPASDTEARRNFWIAALSRVGHLRAQLSALQRAALGQLRETLGLPAELPVRDEQAASALATSFQGRRVAVYTLTESAGKQAADALTALVPSLTVTLFSDHGGSQPLKSAAENADYFVVVACSAKHAATDFIRQHRPGNKPLLYAPGRGASSILRVLDEQLGRLDPRYSH
jgi:hypothetical protein